MEGEHHIFLSTDINKQSTRFSGVWGKIYGPDRPLGPQVKSTLNGSKY